MYSIESERSVIGGMIMSIDVCESALPMLSEAHFYDHASLEVYKAINQVFQRGEFIGRSSLFSQLSQNGFKAHANDWLTELGGLACSWSELDYHLAVLEEFRTKRFLTTSLTNVMNDIGVKESEQTLNAIAELVSDAPTNGSRTPSLTPSQIMERNKQLETAKPIRTGVDYFDDYLYRDAGMYPGHVITTLADSGHGKTHFAMYQAMMVAKAGYKVHWFQLEDIDTKTATYFQTRIPEHADNIMIQSEIDEIESIKAEIRRVKREHGTDYVVIDYIQNVQANKKERTNQVEYVSQSLTRLAKELKIVMHVLSQITIDYNRRHGWKQEPMLGDVRWSQQIKQDSHHTNSVFRPSMVESLVTPEGDKIKQYDNKEMPVNSVYVRMVKLRGGEMRFKRVHFVHDKEGLMHYDDFISKNLAHNHQFRQKPPPIIPYDNEPTPF